MKDKVKELQELIQSKTGRVITPGAVAIPVPKIEPQQQQGEEPALRVIHDQKLLYKGKLCNYYVLGALPLDFASLQVTLSVTEDTSDKRGRYKLDLYERHQCRQYAMEIANLFYADEGIILNELIQLTDLIEQYRDAQVEAQQMQYKAAKASPPVPPTSEKVAVEFLTQPKLTERIDKLLQQAGIHDTQRLLLYIAGASYKSKTPLHIGVTGNSIAVKNLIHDIGQCLPPQDRLLLNQVSAKSFYHCEQGELMPQSNAVATWCGW